MNIITVIPLTRSKVSSTLSYFTAAEAPVGAIVSVPLRKKNIPAIVTESRPAADLKAELRDAPYQIRKLGKVKANAFFPAAFMAACSELADFYATNIGTVIRSLVPEIILEQSGRIAPPLPRQGGFFAENASLADETIAIQGDDTDRFSAWRGLIRQEFAKRQSIVFHAPTMEDARQLFDNLQKGIEKYIFFIHTGLPKKKLLETWAAIADCDHPAVIVTAGLFVLLPRADISCRIIERENGRGWMASKSPYLDARRALERIGRLARQNVYLADSLLRIETLWRLEEHEITSGTPFKWRSISMAADELIDMRRRPDPHNRAEHTTKTPFRVLSPALEEIIRRTQAENSHLFILTARRGLSPITVCDDCQTAVACKQCATPLVLHVSKETGRNFFMCHTCGTRESADIVCAVCGGPRLSPLGIGTERVREELRERFPGLEVFRLDADSATTTKQASIIMDHWRAKPGSVLVGTETALTRLDAPIEYAAVASLDSLLTLPDFRLEERLMYLLTRLRTAANRVFLVQTRRAEEKVFEYGLKGNLSDYFNRVIESRKRFAYPPFSVLIKVSIEGRKDVIARKMGELQALFTPHEVDVFPAFTATASGASTIHGLIKVPIKHWPDSELLAKLRSLPPEVSIKVNPESLL